MRRCTNNLKETRKKGLVFNHFLINIFAYYFFSSYYVEDEILFSNRLIGKKVILNSNYTINDLIQYYNAL